MVSLIEKLAIFKFQVDPFIELDLPKDHEVCVIEITSTENTSIMMQVMSSPDIKF
jgi:hypothetical protein